MDNTEKHLNPFPESAIQGAYDQAELAIKSLPLANENFTPLIESKDARSWDVSTHLAWALRVADSQGNVEMTKKIQESLKVYPSFENFVVYQLLSDSYETEKEMEHGGYSLTQVSEGLKNYASDIIKTQLKITNDPKDLVLFQNIVARAQEFAHEGAKGSTYLSPVEVKGIFDVLKDREAQSDPLLKEGEGAQIYTKLSESFARTAPPLA